jgi:hypothetical protein
MTGTPREPTKPAAPSSLALDRRIRMLRTAMGPEIAQALANPDVVEVLLNPDGSLWLDRLSTGRAPTGITLSPADGERIIRLIAAHVRAEVHADKPLLTAELPETGERFEGALPPVTPGPVFALRKRAVALIRLEDYVADGILTADQAAFLRAAVRDRQNILIETVALYVRYFLTVSTPVPETHQEAARALGRARFEQFIEQLGRHLLRGRSLVKDVYEEIQPEDSQFFGLGDPAGNTTGDDRPATPTGSKPETAS